MTCNLGSSDLQIIIVCFYLYLLVSRNYFDFSRYCVPKFLNPVFLPSFITTGIENTPLQILAVLISLGYFIFDMGWCMYFRTEGPVMLAHHILSILGMLLTLGLGESGTESCAVIFGSEITNPLLQARWFLKRAGRYESLAGDAVDLLFILLFGFVRIGVGSIMLVAVVTSAKPQLVIKAGGVAIYTLSWIFMVDITRFAFRKSCSKYKRWQERRKLDSVNGKAHQH